MPATEEYWRSPKRMHVIFAFSTLTLMLATLLMLYSDYDDEWRDYQKEFVERDVQRAEEIQQKLASAEYMEQTEVLEQAVRAAQDKIEKNQDAVDEAKEKVSKLEAEHIKLSRLVKFERAKRDKARADYDLAVRDEKPAEVRKQYDTIFNNIQAGVLEMERNLDALTVELNAENAKLAKLVADRTEAEDALTKHTRDYNRIQETIVSQQPDPFENPLMRAKKALVNLPLVDMNPTYKIDQIWLPNLTINLGGMKDVPRFDRCITCHKATNRVGAGNVPEFPPESNPHPFQTHPRTDLFITAASPHPQAKFGCTSCHDGQGSGTSFQHASHTPNDPVIKEEWKKEHGYFHNHFWEYPMFPDRFKESTCLKCHHGITELEQSPKFGNSAPKVTQGADLVRQYGCFGCHEIRGYDGLKPIGPDFRLEPLTAEQAEKIAADPTAIAGTMRKVGPSLRHFSSKVTTGWAEVWVEEPKRFRPDTRMPQFFHLSNQQDEEAQKYSPVEIAATVQFLMKNSEGMEYLEPLKDHEPNAENGKLLFAQNGCLSCHSHADFPAATAKVGPDLSRVSEKLLPGEDGFKWLYTWIREPTRYHARTIMPNLYLEPTTVDGKTSDPAADITAYLLERGPHQFGSIEWEKESLNDLVLLFLGKVITPAAAETALEEGKLPAHMTAETVKGDEVELLGDKITEEMKMNYIGRRTISRYGCYGCHDIPGFEDARPIGTALQDWGAKDTSKLAFEHIGEYLHHFGEADGSSTMERAEQAIQNAKNNSFPKEQNPEQELSVAYFYEELNHHGRPGFAWQKLRAPRSYDFRKIETKGYDERLRMPKFPFSEEENEAVVTFLLGLIANPPAEQYVFTPTGADKTRLEGEKLLKKYNCAGCHMLDMPQILAGVDPEELFATDTSGEYPEALDLLFKLKPVHQGETGETLHIPGTEDEEARDLPIISFKGMATSLPDPEDDIEDQEYAFQLWQPLKVGDTLMLPAEPMLVPAKQLVSRGEGRGGDFAKFLVNHMMEVDSQVQQSDAWQMAPPPLYQEGLKVQTPWLYKFLKNPDKLRFSTVLRMPKFNMSDEEAQILANYFAAAEGVEYPYQNIPQREPAYLAEMNSAHENYLENAWNLFTIPRPEGLCVKCHQFGGMEYSSNDPKDKRGPNLNRVAERLQPDWALLWIFKPSWITPYTAMPQNFKESQPQFPQYFGGEGDKQTRAIRDALMNYHRLMESQDKMAGDAASATPAGGE